MSKFALLFLLTFFGCIMATFFYSSSAAFILYEIVYFLNPDDRWWSASIPGISYSFFASVLMLLMLGIRFRYLSEQSPWKSLPAFRWFILLLIWHYVIYLWAQDQQLHWRFTFDYTKLIVIVLVAYKLVNTPRALDAALWAYIIGATYIGYMATITGRNANGRVEGIGMVDAPDGNFFAAALVPAAALLMYYAWMGNKRVKLLCVMCGALIANGLVLINSRGSFVGVVVGAGLFTLYMIFSRYRRKGQRAMAVAIVILGLAGALYVTDDLFWERMQTLEDIEDEDKSGSQRINYWLASIEMSKDYPLGTGVFGFHTLSSQYLPPEYQGSRGYKSVHSIWFQGLSETGWLGMALFGIALLSLYRTLSTAKKWVLENGDNTAYFQLLALQCGFIGYLATASFIDLFRSQVLYWMVLFLAVGINVHFLQPFRAREGAEQGTRTRTTGKPSAIRAYSKGTTT
ncbi:O-antigen ligase family protein [Marinobacter sp. OP 3.4]|uniref:O-antigen ligase family protein n=1 Tax=Marinobacter sp. OP 3.4 TaxID=3076501 RepID=UPI002E2148FD